MKSFFLITPLNVDFIITLPLDDDNENINNVELKLSLNTKRLRYLTDDDFPLTDVECCCYYKNRVVLSKKNDFKCMRKKEEDMMLRRMRLRTLGNG